MKAWQELNLFMASKWSPDEGESLWPNQFAPLLQFNSIQWNRTQLFWHVGNGVSVNNSGYPPKADHAPLEPQWNHPLSVQWGVDEVDGKGLGVVHHPTSLRAVSCPKNTRWLLWLLKCAWKNKPRAQGERHKLFDATKTPAAHRPCPSPCLREN